MMINATVGSYVKKSVKILISLRFFLKNDKNYVKNVEGKILIFTILQGQLMRNDLRHQFIILNFYTIYQSVLNSDI